MNMLSHTRNRCAILLLYTFSALAIVSAINRLFKALSLASASRGRFALMSCMYVQARVTNALQNMCISNFYSSGEIGARNLGRSGAEGAEINIDEVISRLSPWKRCFLYLFILEKRYI